MVIEFHIYNINLKDSIKFRHLVLVVDQRNENIDNFCFYLNANKSEKIIR